MRPSVVLAAIALLVGVPAIAGCGSPTSTPADLDQVANGMLDLAEATLPAMTDDLGATLTKVVSGAAREGGSEGTTPRVAFHVWAWMASSEPSQAELEHALVSAGFGDLAPTDGGTPSDGPRASAISEDGDTLVSASYSATSDVTANLPYPTIRVSFSSVEPLRVSNGTFDDFARDFARQFDQSLVHEAPEAAALRQWADSTLDAAEATLPALADRLGATLESAGLTVDDADADSSQASVTFVVDGVMTGPSTTQSTLEQALVDVGYPDIVSPRDASPSSAPYARATSADGVVEITASYVAVNEVNGEIEVNLSNAVGVTASDATLADFLDAYGRGFDQRLIAPSAR